MRPLVADTGPLNYLIQIEAAEFLPALFSRVWIPQGVARELQAPAAPTMVRNWMRQLPSWCSVRGSPQPGIRTFPRLSPVDIEVLAHATEISAAVLLDDLAARNAARQMGLPVIGTLGILELAGARQLLSLPLFLGRLRQTSIRLSETLYAEALRRSNAGREAES